MNNVGLYIHIPFCERKCNYCGFLSFAGCSDNKKEEYMRALANELKFRLNLLKDYSVDTVFIGGGTPTVVDANSDTIAKIAELVRNKAKDCSEVTIEGNPGTITKEKLNVYRNLGINRLSMGVQSFDDDILKRLGRIHRADDVYESMRLARECGFENINLDLMFGLPGQNIENFLDSLNKGINLNPEHISFYSLQIEENTPFYEEFTAGKLELPKEEVDRDMYHRAISVLKKAGYDHYEISNVAKIDNNGEHKKYYCKHNLKYWSMEEYLGVGLGASSFLGGSRFMNIDDIDEYIELWSNENEYESDNPQKLGTKEWHDNKMHDFASEFVFTGLRKTEGIDLVLFENMFDVPFFSYFEAQYSFAKLCAAQGLLVLDEERGRMSLTEKGIDISNAIMAEFV